ncbi:MAG: hypothetical protein ABSF48_19025, partial [Thermodesulfobacteriota bacterium]
MVHRKEISSNLFAKGVLCLLVLLIPGLAVAADDDSTTLSTLASKLPSWAPKLLGAQATGIYQYMPSFNNPYQGEKSLIYDNGRGRQLTQTYGVYFGSQLTDYLQAYLDVEMFRGKGISEGLGLGGYTNGDVIRAGPANLGEDPYLARLYLRYLIPLSEERSEVLERGMDQLP